MEFVLRSQEHTEPEKQLLHNLSFSVLDGVNYETDKTTDNILSVTSDLDGFTTLNSVCRVLNWKKEVVQLDVNGCNEIDSSRLISQVSPSLFMIPKSKNKESIIEHPHYYISELIKVGDYFQSKTVQFTHYSLVEKLPTDEIVPMLVLLLNPVFVPKIEKFYWEIDSRFLSEMKFIYQFVIEEIYRREFKEPQVIHGKKFKFVDVQDNGDSIWSQFEEDGK
jgi:hypothetical protein